MRCWYRKYLFIASSIVLMLIVCIWVWSNFHEVPLEQKFEIDDTSLNKLVSKAASLSELVHKYGEPIFVIGENVDNEQYVYFDLTLHHVEFLPPKTGRIGFCATIKNGKIIEWDESTRY